MLFNFRKRAGGKKTSAKTGEGRQHLSFYTSIKLSHSFRGQKRVYLARCHVRLLRRSGVFVFKLRLLRLLGGRLKIKMSSLHAWHWNLQQLFARKSTQYQFVQLSAGPFFISSGRRPAPLALFCFFLHEQLENMRAFRRVPSFRPWRTMKCLIHNFQHSNHRWNRVTEPCLFINMGGGVAYACKNNISCNLMSTRKSLQSTEIQNPRIPEMSIHGTKKILLIIFLWCEEHYVRRKC